MGTRGRYEFPSEVIDSARRKWHEEHPGQENTKLEIDHHIPVWFAKKYGIPPDLVRTRANARALTHEEHQERHRNEPTEEEYITLAVAILGWVRNLL